jgi:hypothetical protein
MTFNSKAARNHGGLFCMSVNQAEWSGGLIDPTFVTERTLTVYIRVPRGGERETTNNLKPGGNKTKRLFTCQDSFHDSHTESVISHKPVNIHVHIHSVILQPFN